eukprot:TRINITY_DN6206_c0_g2_i1.p1 TRINITY_DN6206_c0_g2~~TRINITY_DN6206_c0_g2_i1.p1  ORF type:complete len:143 (+),score=64.91 TRINITY_DN6206_c0_g2_i1:65-493(+)
MRAAAVAFFVACIVFASAEEDEEAGTFTKIDGYETKYQILTEGEGQAVGKGDKVKVHATGVVGQTGKKFWSTKDDNHPFSYTAGRNQVITGWDQGVLGMKVGEERLVIIPGHEGYGAKGNSAWGIPPNGVLEFTIEVLEIRN